MSKNETPSAGTSDNSGKPALMNGIWFFLLAAAVLCAAFRGNMAAVTEASFEAAKNAVNLAIGLVGAMALWLGLIRVAEAGGLMNVLARGIRPLMTRLFPDVPPEDPAMAAMVLNMAANALGLGNAATPLGIKAMMALNRLNPRKGCATDAMCLFLAINTSNVTLLPLGVISIRAAAGASDPAAVLVPTLIATTCSTAVAITAAKILKNLTGDKHEERGDPIPSDNAGVVQEPAVSEEEKKYPYHPSPIGKWVAGSVMLLFFLALFWHASIGNVGLNSFSNWLVPGLMIALVGYGLWQGVPVYEAATRGAEDGFKVAVRLIPFLVMILVAIGMFRASGAFDMLARLLTPLTGALNIPVDVLPVALLRPLSGSGAFGLMSEITAADPDGFSAFLAGTIQGSTETTFYVLAVYFGSVGIHRARYAVAAALLADLAGFLAALTVCHWLYPA